MKKIFRLLLTFSFNTVLVTNAIACSVYDFGGGGSNVPPSPPVPVPKDIKYYQDLMKQSQVAVNEFIDNINELAKYKDDKDLFPTPQDYDRTISELKAEQSSYQAVIYDCQYQILNLQTNGNFTPQQKTQAITYLQQEIIQLNNELTTKKQYADDYDKTELEVITKQLNSIQIILNNLLKS